MTGQINVNKIAARTGNTITVESGDVLSQPGSVIQVVQNTSSTLATISSNSYVTTGFAVSITPKLATSKLLLTVSVYITISDGGQGSINIYSSADSGLITDKTNGFGGPYGNMEGSSMESINTINFLTDAVGSTASRTYTLYGKSSAVDPTYFLNSTRLSTFTITEIAQ